jgi:hypothetical protein
MGSSRTCCPTRALSFDSVAYRAGCESMPIGYNCRLCLELGLAAVLKSGSAFVVRWHCLVLRGGGCSRPTMMLLGSCALRIGTEIGWKPEIHMAHINGSHGEKLSCLIDSPGKRNDDFLGSLEGAQREIYTCPFTSPKAHICRTRLPWYYAGLHPQQPTRTETARRMTILSFSRLHSPPPSPAPPPFANGM